MLSKILVPLDGSETAEQIGKWTTSMARSIEAEVIVVSVVDPKKVELPGLVAGNDNPVSSRSGPYDRPGIESSGGVIGTFGSTSSLSGHSEEAHHITGAGSRFLDQVVERATSYVESQAASMKQAGIDSSSISLVGDPAEEIIRYSGECNAGLIVMATHRGSAIARGVLGSVTDRVLHGCEIPVLAVHPESAGTFSEDGRLPDTIVVPLDGSNRSASVVSLALNLAKAIGAQIVFLHVLKSSVQDFTPGANFFSASSSSIQRASAEESLGLHVAETEAAGVEGRSLVISGTPADGILSEVRAFSRPMIVMSTRGQTGLKRWVLGSVTDKVMRSSGIPVIIVPPANSVDEVHATEAD